MGDFGPPNNIAAGYVFPGDAKFADLDLDGDDDAIVTGISEDKFAWFENTGLGAFSSVGNNIDSNRDAPSIIAPGDFDKLLKNQ